MADTPRIGLDEGARHFEELEDPRATSNRRHPPSRVVVLALMAVRAGASGPTALAKWALLKRELVRKARDRPNGIPCQDVFPRVLGTRKPGAFPRCFAHGLESPRSDAAVATGGEQPVWAGDGQTVRRSQDRENGLGALPAVRLGATEFGLTLGQVARDAKSNEITAIPELLKRVDLQGALLTIDARGPPNAIAARMSAGEADSVLALKGDQEMLHQAVIHQSDEPIDDGLPKGRGAAP